MEILDIQINPEVAFKEEYQRIAGKDTFSDIIHDLKQMLRKMEMSSTLKTCNVLIQEKEYTLEKVGSMSEQKVNLQ